MRGRTVVLGAAVIVLAMAGWCEESADPDAKYIATFLKDNPKVATPLPFAEYANAAVYDERFMGKNLDDALAKISNDSGGIAWGLSYRMMSLNDMYRATQDTKYLDANLRCIEAVLAVTDEKLGKQLWNGRIVPAWGSEKYAERGRAVFPVHTGIITAPMYEFLGLAKENAAYREKIGDTFDTIRAAADTALAVHDRQWREGPGEKEGYYIGLDQEKACENKPLPGNRLNAMGWSMWASWKVSGNTTHHDRAIALGHYFKNRVTPSPDGAYYWPYWLPEAPVTESKPREKISGEDSSHAGLTMSLVFALAADGEVFTAEDMGRFAKTVLNGLGRRPDGILISRITGTTELKPSYIGLASQWIPLAQYDPEVRTRILAYFLNYRPHPHPRELAQLLRYPGGQE